MDSSEAKKIAKSILSKERFYHTECVATAAKQLAKRFGVDVEQAKIAAFLHDIAKEFDRSVLLQMLVNSDTIEHDNLRDCPSVWHSHAGAIYIQNELGIDDEIASAVRFHTTAKADMTLLEKIVFLADCTSSDRTEDYLAEIRKKLQKCQNTMEALDHILLSAIESQIKYIIETNRMIHLDSIGAYNYLIANKTNGD